MDKDETLKINYDEFREYLLLHPSSDIWDIVHYWRHASVRLVQKKKKSKVMQKLLTKIVMTTAKFGYFIFFSNVSFLRNFGYEQVQKKVHSKGHCCFQKRCIPLFPCR